MKHVVAIEPKIGEYFIELQMSHQLPINITLKEKVADMDIIEFEYDKEDEKLFLWLLQKGTNRFLLNNFPKV